MPLLNVLSVAVTVCGMESVFVQTTESPALMVMCADENAVGVIETLTCAAALTYGIKLTRRAARATKTNGVREDEIIIR